MRARQYVVVKRSVVFWTELPVLIVVQGPVLVAPCCHVTMPLQLFSVRTAASSGQTTYLSADSGVADRHCGWSSTMTVTEFDVTGGHGPLVVTTVQ
jgi:hypothetical protein